MARRRTHQFDRDYSANDRSTACGEISGIYLLSSGLREFGSSFRARGVRSRDNRRLARGNRIAYKCSYLSCVFFGTDRRVVVYRGMGR